MPTTIQIIGGRAGILSKSDLRASAAVELETLQDFMPRETDSQTRKLLG